MESKIMINQGAEGKLYTGSFYNKPCIIKERFVKSYRHPSLDKSLTTQRMKAEGRALLRCKMSGIECPSLYMVDMENRCIIMEKIENSITVREYIIQLQQENNHEQLVKLAKNIGQLLSKVHSNNLIHGDLTTSNMLLKNWKDGCDEIVLIDFGLSYFNSLAEDKGVDLYVLERAFLSTHPNSQDIFQFILDSYSQSSAGEVSEVIKKLEEVRMRGRKRTMVG